MRRDRLPPSCTTYDSEGRATDAEVEFIRGLGTHLETPRMDRLRLLRSYLASMERRTNWGHIDQARVRYEVEQEIEREAGKRPVFIPTNGRGLYAARAYAVPVSEYRREVRRNESEDE